MIPSRPGGWLGTPKFGFSSNVSPEPGPRQSAESWNRKSCHRINPDAEIGENQRTLIPTRAPMYVRIIAHILLRNSGRPLRADPLNAPKSIGPSARAR